MRYSKPQLVNTVNATSTIQQVFQTTDAGKISMDFLDSATPKHRCTAGAYEADE